LPDIGSIALSFLRSSVPALMARGPRTARFPHVRFRQARGRRVGQMASKRSRSKWRQPFTCFMKLEEPKRRQKERQAARSEQATPALPWRVEAGSGPKKKKAVGGRRNPLIKLDSAKEIQGFEFGFRSARLGICSIRLGFRSEKFGYRSGGFGNPSSRSRVFLPHQGRLCGALAVAAASRDMRRMKPATKSGAVTGSICPPSTTSR
jgi:hypothetical protein